MFRNFHYLAAAAIVSILVFAAAALQIGADYHETRSRNERMAADIARVVDAHVAQTVHQTANLLQLVADMVGEDGGVDRMPLMARWHFLHAYCATLLGCRTMAVVDPRGMVVTRSDAYQAAPLDSSARQYFTGAVHSQRLFIAPAVVTRLPGNPILFTVSLPVYSRDGELLAVVTAGLDTDHITRFYGLMGFGMHPTVTIFKRNGDIVARNPDMAGQVGKNNARGQLFTERLPHALEGAYESTSTLDGRQRLAAYRSLPALDLVVFAGVEVDEAVGAWRQRANRTSWIVGGMLLLIQLALYAGHRFALRQRRLEARNSELHALADLDGLTGIPNRRSLDQLLLSHWQRHQLQGAPLSVILLDVDHFKAYNDRYGHLQGDACLRTVAQALQACLRDGDRVARYGGEEFAAVLACDLADAATVAERMREAIASLRLPHDRSSASAMVSVSAGVASASSATAHLQALLTAADGAMYAAKAQGRNRVCRAGPPPAPLAEAA